jgi:preprotein translocase subunit SecE
MGMREPPPMAGVFRSRTLPIVRLTTYIKESHAELRKVIWPTRRELVRHSLLVIGVSLGLAAFLGAVDYLATLGFAQFLRLR